MTTDGLKIGLAGLALSHPFTFADILMRHPGVEIHYWDERPDRMQSFAKTHAGAIAHTNFAELLDANVQGVMVCTESHLHHQYAISCLEREIPVFIDKCMVVDEAALAALTSAIEHSQTPVFSSSILRYSPDFRAQAKRVREQPREQVLQAEAVIYHSIAGYLNPGNEWQDVPEQGGGTLLNMGIHGLELMALFFGCDVRRVFAHASKRYYSASRSEDVAFIHLEYADGLVGTIRLIGATKMHGYQMSVATHEGLDSVLIPTADAERPLQQYGYEGCVEEFVELMNGKEVSTSIQDTIFMMKILLAARRSASTSNWVDV